MEKIDDSLFELIQIIENFKTEPIISEESLLIWFDLIDEQIKSVILDEIDYKDIVKKVLKYYKEDVFIKTYYKKLKEKMKSKLYLILSKEIDIKIKVLIDEIKANKINNLFELELLFRERLRLFLQTNIIKIFDLKTTINYQISDFVFEMVYQKEIFQKKLKILKIFYKFKFFHDEKSKIIFDGKSKKEYEKLFILSQKCFVLSNINNFIHKSFLYDIITEKIKNLENVISVNKFHKYLEKYKNKNDEALLKIKFNKLIIEILYDESLHKLSLLLYNFSIMILTKSQSPFFKQFESSSFTRTCILTFFECLHRNYKDILNKEIDFQMVYMLIEQYLYETLNLVNINKEDYFDQILNYSDVRNLIGNIKLLERYDKFKNEIDKNNTMFVKKVYEIKVKINEVFINLEDFKIIPHYANKNSPHILFLISGFTTKDKDEDTLWKGIVDNYQYKHYDKFFFKWDSKKEEDYLKTSVIFNFLKSIFNKNNGNLFKEAEKVAKMYGILLALTISSKNYFDNKTISFITYSLGCHVLKHCLKELYSLYLNKISNNIGIIQNIVFVAGATTIKNKKKWTEIIKSVPGKIYNIVSVKDDVLRCLYPIFSKNNLTKPLGLSELNIYNKCTTEIKNTFNHVTNLDLSGDKIGHLNYLDLIDIILNIIYFK